MQEPRPLCGTHDTLAGVEAYYELPRGQPAGIVFLAHGACHGAYDWWPAGEHCPAGVGLAEEQRIVRGVLDAGWAALALSSKDRVTKWWKAADDTPRVVRAIAEFRRMHRLGSAPLAVFGVSAGGTFALQLPRVLELRAIVCQIMAAHPHSLVGGRGKRSAVGFPPTLFQHMPRDTRTAALVDECVAHLSAAGVRAASSGLPPQPIDAGYVARRIPGVAPRVSSEVRSALKGHGLLDDDDRLRDDPRRTRWRSAIPPALRAALPGARPGAGDSLVPDESCLSEVLNVAWGVHEIFGDRIAEAVQWITADDASASPSHVQPQLPAELAMQPPRPAMCLCFACTRAAAGGGLARYIGLSYDVVVVTSGRLWARVLALVP